MYWTYMQPNNVIQRLKHAPANSKGTMTTFLKLHPSYWGEKKSHASPSEHIQSSSASLIIAAQNAFKMLETALSICWVSW